ncbi:MAG: DUF1835 domain-containing protein [Oscillospiraceae bacterium]|nr:DUF1835 domain-containing protein [Oscillospiraceae bacterium]
MIEVLFGESEAGAMKVALQSGKLGSDVICLGFALEIGDIKKPVTSEYRTKLLYNLLYQEQWGEDIEMKNELKALGKAYSKELDKLFEHLDSGEPIRIWYDSAPYSMCGLLWLCGELKDRECSVSTVRLPHVTIKGNTAVSYASWGEVPPNRFAYFLNRERALSSAEIMVYAHYWSELMRENAPLRAVVNGSVMSVPASFYDFLIWKNLDDTPVREAVLIGKVLSEDHIGVGDWWYAYRIDKFIAQNRIKIVNDSPRKYDRIIAKNEI